jgi:hypothetical protein
MKIWTGGLIAAGGALFARLERGLGTDWDAHQAS